MFIEAILIGLFIGGFKGGRLTNIIDMNIRGWYLILVALVLQILPIILSNFEVIISLQNYILFLSLFLIILVTLINIDKKGFLIILIGGLYNILIMALNNFKMPISMKALESAGLTATIDGINDGSIINYMFSGDINFLLTKFIAIPKAYLFPKVLSIGDIIITIGIIILIIYEMSKTNYFGKSKMIRYSYKPNRR